MSEGRDEQGTPRPKGITISREIRAGELLQLVGFLATVAALWNAIDIRVTKVEGRQDAQAVQMQEVRVELRDNIREIRVDAKETQSLVRGIENRIARKGL
jgi:hypothetical protein